MPRSVRTAAALLLASGLVAVPSAAQRVLKINGSTTVNPVVAEAAEYLRQRSPYEIRVDTVGGSSGGLAALGDGRVDLAMSSRPVSERDRHKYPEIEFRPYAIGLDAIALVVSRDVWAAGVRSLSLDQMRGIYEGRLTNWSQLGGHDQRIVFFNKEPGRGTREMFLRWLYGNPDDAPLISFPEVGSNEETRLKVASTLGALASLSVAWADRQTVFALALAGHDDEPLEPSLANVQNGEYPLTRPLLLVSDGVPTGIARTLLDLLLSATGQEMVERHGYLPVRSEQAEGE